MAIFAALLQGLYINSHAAFGLSNLRLAVKKNYQVHVNCFQLVRVYKHSLVLGNNCRMQWIGTLAQVNQKFL